MRIGALFHRLCAGPWRSCVFAALFSFFTSAIASLWVERHLPLIHDEFAYLLQAETFAAGRLANPAHPLADFFEAPHVLHAPTYASKYPPGHAVFLAAGMCMDAPILGVWLENAFFAAALAWMLGVFFAPRWAALGAALAVLQLGMLNYWTQGYWVVPLAAAGGALVWGGVFAVGGRGRRSDGWLLGLGVACLVFSRPFEGALACVVPATVLLVRWCAAKRPGERARLARVGIAPATFVVLATFCALALYNRAVTGDAMRLPYSAYELRHSGAPLFAWQTETHHPGAGFSAPSLAAFHERFVLPTSYLSTFNFATWSLRLRDTAISNLGWILSALALLGAALAVSRRTSPCWARLAVLSLGVCSLGFLVSVWFEVHYYLPMLPLFLALAVLALRRLHRSLGGGHGLAWTAAAACGAVALGLVFNGQFERSPGYYQMRLPRQKAIDALAAHPGRFVILVRAEEPFDLHRTYVANAADIDAARIVWAWDRGDVENRRLLDYYPDRQALLMRASTRGMSLHSYVPSASP